MDITKSEEGRWEVQIDDHTYSFEKWGADDATDTLIDLMGIVGKPLGMALAALSGGGSRELDPDLVGSVVEGLMGNLVGHKETCKKLIKKFSSAKVLCDGKPINFNQHFSDRLPHLIQVVTAGVEVQYGNFFGDLLGKYGIKMPTPGQKMGIANAPPSNDTSGG